MGEARARCSAPRALFKTKESAGAVLARRRPNRACAVYVLHHQRDLSVLPPVKMGRSNSIEIRTPGSAHFAMPACPQNLRPKRQGAWPRSSNADGRVESPQARSCARGSSCVWWPRLPTPQSALHELSSSMRGKAEVRASQNGWPRSGAQGSQRTRCRRHATPGDRRFASITMRVSY